MKRSRASRRSNVATSPRRDVLTSRRWVNKYSSQQVATSRRGNVATSRRGNVATSRRQREIFPPSLKAAKGSELEASGGVRTRAQNSRAAATPTWKKCP